MAERLLDGTQCEVLNQFERRWTRGFEVAESVGGGYRLRRLSDGSVLPVVFAVDTVRGAWRGDGARREVLVAAI
jgi:hypothetical protein